MCDFKAKHVQLYAPIIYKCLFYWITTCNVCQNEGEWSRVQNIVTPMDHTVLYMQLIHGLSRFEFNIQKILWWEGGGGGHCNMGVQMYREWEGDRCLYRFFLGSLAGYVCGTILVCIFITLHFCEIRPVESLMRLSTGRISQFWYAYQNFHRVKILQVALHAKIKIIMAKRCSSYTSVGHQWTCGRTC